MNEVKHKFITVREDKCAEYMDNTHIILTECYPDDSDCCEAVTLPNGAKVGRKVIGWCSPANDAEALDIAKKAMSGEL